MSIKKEETASAVPTNNAGGGNVDGIGVGPRGEPGIKPKKKKLRVLFPIIKRQAPGVKSS
jgi:hypothetical protein